MARPKIHEIRDAFFNSPYGANLLFNQNEDSFYRFTGKYYEFINHKDFEIIIDEFITDYYPRDLDNTTQTIKEIIASLKRANKAEYLRRYESDYPSPFIAFKDKVFDFSTLTLKKHSPDIPAFHYIDFDFPSLLTPIETPAFDKFMRETFVSSSGDPDPQLASFMLQALAFYITPENYQPMALILNAPGANGKSVYLNILQMLIGRRYITALSMEQLSRRFNAISLLNKRLNLVSEDQSSYIDTARVKALISQEYIEAEVKYKDNIRFRPTVKYIFSSNKEIKFKHIDHGTMRRLAIVPFYRTFVDKGDPAIDGKLVCEKDTKLLYETPNGWAGKLYDERRGIMQKIIFAAKAIKANNYIIELPDAVKATVIEAQRTSSSALDFFHEKYVVDYTSTELVSNDRLYQEYLDWFNASGRPEKYLMQPRQFIMALTKNIIGINTDKKMYIDGKQVRCKTHLRRKDTLDNVLDF